MCSLRCVRWLRQRARSSVRPSRRCCPTNAYAHAVCPAVEWRVEGPARDLSQGVFGCPEERWGWCGNSAV